MWLRDLNSDLDRRNLDSAGLPSSLKFSLSREDTTPDVELELEENKRLNVNAPVFVVKSTSSGKQELIRKAFVPIQVNLLHVLSQVRDSISICS